MKFEAGDTILYAGSGVCKIDEIAQKDLGLGKMDYYILKPISSSNNTFYVPTDKEALTSKMRKLLSENEIDEILSSMPDMDVNWIDNDNLRREKYKEIIRESDISKLIKLTKSIYAHKQTLAEKGKKLRLSDENIMREAENIILDELSEVLNIDRDNVLSFIINRNQEA